MTRLRAAVAIASGALLTGGCIAAAIPIAAGGMIARDQLRDRSGREARPAVPKTAGPLSSPVGASVTDAVKVTPTTLTALPPPPGEGGAPRPAGMAGEDAAYSLQAYQALWTYLSAQIDKRKRGEPLRSAVLAPDASLNAPRYLPCQNKSLALVLDLDENPAKSTDPEARWRRWKGDGSDALVAVPGAVDGVEAARREGVTVIFSATHGPEDAAGVMAVIERLGFGRVELGKTLYLRGSESGTGERTRQAIAAGHCVIAVVGDSLGDFSDLFGAVDNADRQPVAATETMVAPLWGAGWFLLPNPVRSTATPSSNPSGE